MKIHFTLQQVLILFILFAVAPLKAQQLKPRVDTLDEDNWELVPKGKEVDAIHGDFLIRNAHVVAVVAQPIPTRHANLTVKKIGGCLIDLTTAENQNDQLSCFYPGARSIRFGNEVVLKVDGKVVEPATKFSEGIAKPKYGAEGNEVTLTFFGRLDDYRVELTYRLRENDKFLSVETTYTTESDKPNPTPLYDSIRADRTFEFGKKDLIGVVDGKHAEVPGYFWAYDQWFNQAYGFTAFEGTETGVKAQVELLVAKSIKKQGAFNEDINRLIEQAEKESGPIPGRIENARFADNAAEHFLSSEPVRAVHAKQVVDSKRLVIERVETNSKEVLLSYQSADGESPQITIENPRTFTRRIYPSPNLFSLHKQIEGSLANFGESKEVVIEVVDDIGPVRDAKIKLIDADGNELLWSRTNENGKIHSRLGLGPNHFTVKANGRKLLKEELEVSAETESLQLKLSSLGYLEVQATTESGTETPCKVGIYGLDKIPNPNFGPDSRAKFIKNLVYSANGLEKIGLAPGSYEAVISRGPEYDAVIKQFEIRSKESTVIAAKLVRSVDTEGWVSAEYHSHSSPSGDNTSDQLGRVYNLLAEHIEFAPCTEHNRIDSYSPHLEALHSAHLMATCTGMELTGSVLPVNHQNAFPLQWKPGKQDGGGPVVDSDPVAQIQRLKMWDNGAEKLVQMNHPNLVTVNADKDNDGNPDDGFHAMFEFVDVIEVHPLESILNDVTELPRANSRGNVIFNWLQLLNDGFRIPGVVNTDAHYNFHGSGWLRNYVRSSSDLPTEINTLEMVRNSGAGKVLMTNAPFLTVTAKGKFDGLESLVGIGEDLKIADDTVELEIRVQCANWYDINRVQILVNGRMEPELNFTRRTHPEMFSNETLKFDESVRVKLKEDANLIVLAIGEGLKLGRVMGSQAKWMPTAVSNPIWVDKGGDGFVPNHDRLEAPFLSPPENGQ